MSLQTDRVFFNALNANAQLLTVLGNRLYNTAILKPEKDAANTPAPYVIVGFEGFNNDQSTKDSYEGNIDHVNVGVLVVAINRKQLAQLIDTVRRTIKGYFESLTPESADFQEAPEDYQLSGEPILYDEAKPAVHTKLTYACDVPVNL